MAFSPIDNIELTNVIPQLIQALINFNSHNFCISKKVSFKFVHFLKLKDYCVEFNNFN